MKPGVILLPSVVVLMSFAACVVVDHVENLQPLCALSNEVKGDRPQEYLVARLREMGMVA